MDEEFEEIFIETEAENEVSCNNLSKLKITCLGFISSVVDKLQIRQITFNYQQKHSNYYFLFYF